MSDTDSLAFKGNITLESGRSGCISNMSDIQACPSYVQVCLIFEPPHKKMNNVDVRPAKAQISLGIRPV